MYCIPETESKIGCYPECLTLIDFIHPQIYCHSFGKTGSDVNKAYQISFGIISRFHSQVVGDGEEGEMNPTMRR